LALERSYYNNETMDCNLDDLACTCKDFKDGMFIGTNTTLRKWGNGVKMSRSWFEREIVHILQLNYTLAKYCL